MRTVSWKKNLQKVIIYQNNKPIELNNSFVDDSFQFAVWPILFVGQFIGFLPINGARKTSKFRWISIPILISIFYISFEITIMYLYINRMQKTGATSRKIGRCIFYAFNSFCYVFFVYLSTKWKLLMDKWNKSEEIFLKKPYDKTKYRLSTKIRFCAFGIFTVALSEHFVYLVQVIWNNMLKIHTCNLDIEDRVEFFFYTEYRHVFEIFPYSIPLAFLSFWVNLVSVISWSFADIFVIVCSIGLSTRFQQINNRLKAVQHTDVSENVWYEIRNHYVTLCELIDTVDKDLAPLILLTCTNNLFFICYQLLNIFQKLPYMVNYIYFWCSLIYLIGRSIFTLMCAATINEESKRPIDVIRWVQSEEWSWEVERFSDQIKSQEIALSGMRFFFLTRKLLLGMLGTILTYELVLLQFAKNQDPNTSENVKQIAAFCEI